MKGNVITKLRKKLCVIGLAAASVFIGTATPLAVNMAQTEEAQAATTSSITTWMNSKNGKKIDYDGRYGNQCVDLFNVYLKDNFGISNPIATVPVGTAKEIYNYNIPGFDKYAAPISNWKVGDIVIWNPNTSAGETTGHVAIVYSVNGSEVKVLEQNYNQRNLALNAKYTTVNTLSASRKTNYVRGIFRPRLEVIPDPPINYYWPLEDGYYTLKTAVGNRFLDVSGMGTADRTNVQIWEAPGAHSGQIFYLGKNDARTGYYLKNLNSGTFVDTTISGRNTANPVGADNVMIYHGDGSKGQQWNLEDAGNGNYFVKNLYGYYLDVANGVDANGTNVNTWQKNGSAAQQWKFTRVSGKNLANVADGDYMIYSKVGNRVLNAAGDRTSNGTNLQIWDPLDVGGNIYTVSKSGRFVTKIKNKAANRMVDSSGGLNEPENVQLWDDNNGYGQSWYVEDAGDGYVYIRNLWGYYLDVANGVNANGTNVNTWHFNGSDAQKWKFVKYTKTDVTGVSVSPSSKTAEPDETFTLTATVSPSNATDKSVSWSSSNTNVATVDNNGKVTAKSAGTATITVKTADGGKTASCAVTVKSKDRFSDVKPDDWYYKAVEWAAANGIATGSNGMFKPQNVCNREEAVTFIWRMMGKPEPKSMKSKFSDVTNASRYSYKAIMWGTEKGIITGANGKYAPTNPCTREQIVTMIWRAAGKPNASGTNFSDVKSDRYSTKAILWAKNKGIATGSGDKFAPTNKCRRCDIITFLYRYKTK